MIHEYVATAAFFFLQCNGYVFTKIAFHSHLEQTNVKRESLMFVSFHQLFINLDLHFVMHLNGILASNGIFFF